jgi:hypothetical protein
MITEETRNESFLKTDRATRRSVILAALGDEELTARELLSRIGFNDMNFVRPRLTELMQSGRVEAAGKKWDKITERNVTVFRRKTNA